MDVKATEGLVQQLTFRRVRRTSDERLLNGTNPMHLSKFAF